ncbi:MAG: transglycosylase SLT domain-containing protein [Candidatus Sericytochromatia bacterium]|nr:transglycosylase SLT domain-containing protein [Candidatus Tanganyikabacteria bacterium]
MAVGLATAALGLIAGVAGAAVLTGGRTEIAGIPGGAEAPRVAIAALPEAQRQFEGLRELDALLKRYRAKLLGSAEEWGVLARDFGALAAGARGSAATWAGLVQADCLDRAGNTGEAAAIWGPLSQGSGPLAGYSTWRLGGRGALDAAAGNRFLGGFGAEVLVAAGEADPDPLRSTSYFKQAIEANPRSLAAERARFLLATRPGPEKAASAMIYLRDYSDGRYFADVARSLVPGAYTEAQRIELAGSLMDRGDYGPAARLLENARSAMGLYRLGRCYWKLGDTKRAGALFVAAQRIDPSLKTRIQLARADMALGRRAWDEAIALARVVAREPGKAGLDGLSLMVKTYLRADRDGEAAWIDKEVIARYPDSEAATEARWRAFWKAYRDGRTDAARAWAQGLSTQGGLLGAAGGFWLGRIEQDAGRTSAAVAAYNNVSRRSPHTYYGWRARFRAAALSGTGSDPGFAVKDGPVNLPDYDLRGLLPEAERGFLGASRNAILAETDTWPADVRILAYLGLLQPEMLPEGRARVLVAHSVGAHYQGITWAKEDPYLSNPLGYWPALESAARQNGLDPLFFAALVKQESYFDPRSRSWVGAMGLAQLMPFTADWVSRQIPGPRKPLTDPAYNLKLGTWYLAYAGRIFENQPILATAAYNAGVGAAKRWRGWYGSDLEEFIERIPYRETRHYVKKVYGYYWTYQWLYRDRALLATGATP